MATDEIYSRQAIDRSLASYKSDGSSRNVVLVVRLKCSGVPDIAAMAKLPAPLSSHFSHALSRDVRALCCSLEWLAACSSSPRKGSFVVDIVLYLTN